MLQSFKAFIEEESLFKIDERILLAVSGGIDSMVMLNLFHEADLNFGIAHCNFKLRGEESDQDAYFVQQQAHKYACEYHEKSFDTVKYAKKQRISIQMAARDLRYQWFDELLRDYGYITCATAHHKDDLAETFLINMLRGTGITGLSGMKPSIGNRIRPMLFANRQEIEVYRDTNHILFREDRSNQDHKYIRNYIRHQVIPLFNDINPAFSEKIVQTMDHLKSVEMIYHAFIEKAKLECILEQEEGSFKISVQKLLNQDHPKACLFEFLQPYNFNPDVIRDIFKSLKGIPGKIFVSPSHRLLFDRKYLLIEPTSSNEKSSFRYYIEKTAKTLEHPVNIEFKKRDRKKVKIDPSPLIAHIDMDKLKFPLVVRKWKEGDFFYPLGMDGKKKISDFLIDLKIPVFDKERIWLLCSDEQVVWVIGLRIDDRFKISDDTEAVFRAEVKY